jgi:hypothetical protein
MGKRIVNATCDGRDVDLSFEDGSSMRFYSVQDCCNEMYIEDGADDVPSLVGEVVTICEAVQGAAPEGVEVRCAQEYEEWTFLKINHVTLRWFGTSNGYYAMSPSAECRDKDGEEC